MNKESRLHDQIRASGRAIGVFALSLLALGSMAFTVEAFSNNGSQGVEQGFPTSQKQQTVLRDAIISYTNPIGPTLSIKIKRNNN